MNLDIGVSVSLCHPLYMTLFVTMTLKVTDGRFRTGDSAH
ncbi:hypothetical protein L914_19635 [Phytophthora nicotianae]|uniref:Uncharacterized protein n=2 Tax=Phytophthora nicotianae TaxID=4792 RepID=V9E155_PHYNI|nr:hypothetical protein F443_20416 [Phytophthora nicotianae P1569]ETM33088.1 hypothetical protein L914_19635 [Phytophthora nicotianae]